MTLAVAEWLTTRQDLVYLLCELDTVQNFV